VIHGTECRASPSTLWCDVEANVSDSRAKLEEQLIINKGQASVIRARDCYMATAAPRSSMTCSLSAAMSSLVLACLTKGFVNAALLSAKTSHLSSRCSSRWRSWFGSKPQMINLHCHSHTHIHSALLAEFLWYPLCLYMNHPSNKT
jgi:hypothetical protein